MVNKSSTNINGKQTAMFGKHLVLLADDSSIMRSTISYLLEQAGYTVVGEASTGEEAVMLSVKLRPHVVIMDVNMPGMGGIRAAARLRMLMPEVEVIGISMSDDKSTIDRMMAAGAIGFVSKTHVKTLVQEVREAIEHGGNSSDGREAPYDEHRAGTAMISQPSESKHEINKRKRTSVVAAVVLVALIASGALPGWALAALQDNPVSISQLATSPTPAIQKNPGSILPANVEQMRAAGVTERQIKAISESLFEYHFSRIELQGAADKAQLTLIRLMAQAVPDRETVTQSIGALSQARGELLKLDVLIKVRMREVLGEGLVGRLREQGALSE